MRKTLKVPFRENGATAYSLSHVWLFATPCTVAYQALLHGILQARILEWVAMPSSRGSSWPRGQTQVSCTSCIGRWILYHWATWEAPKHCKCEGLWRWSCPFYSLLPSRLCSNPKSKQFPQKKNWFLENKRWKVYLRELYYTQLGRAFTFKVPLLEATENSIKFFIYTFPESCFLGLLYF